MGMIQKLEKFLKITTKKGLKRKIQKRKYQSQRLKSQNQISIVEIVKEIIGDLVNV